jgi:hypothetical protein
MTIVHPGAARALSAEGGKVLCVGVVLIPAGFGPIHTRIHLSRDLLRAFRMPQKQQIGQNAATHHVQTHLHKTNVDRVLFIECTDSCYSLETRLPDQATVCGGALTAKCRPKETLRMISWYDIMCLTSLVDPLLGVVMLRLGSLSHVTAPLSIRMYLYWMVVLRSCLDQGHAERSLCNSRGRERYGNCVKQVRDGATEGR